MTNYRFTSYIPSSDIKVRPKVLVDNIYEVINKLKNDEINSNKKDLINFVYKELKKVIEDYNFWYSVSAYRTCTYQFTDLKENNITRICGKRIDSGNLTLCAKHNPNHIHKPIKIDINNRCSISKNNGERCKYKIEINNICKKHNRIEFFRNYYDINKEIDLFYNINIEDINQPTIELLEIVGGNLNNSDSSRNNVHNVIDIEKKVNEKVDIDNNINDSNSISTNNSTINSNDNSNIIKIIKMKKSLENNNISNNISNCYDIIEELNNKITENNNIIENIINNYKSYIKIDHKKCEANNCKNYKDYNIIYNTYCIEHIHNRPNITRPNFFKPTIR